LELKTKNRSRTLIAEKERELTVFLAATIVAVWRKEAESLNGGNGD